MHGAQFAGKGVGQCEVSLSGAHGKDFTQKEKQCSSLSGIALSTSDACHMPSCNHKRLN